MVYFMAIPRLTLHEHYNGNKQTKNENWINSSKKCIKILLTGTITNNLNFNSQNWDLLIVYFQCLHYYKLNSVIVTLIVNLFFYIKSWHFHVNMYKKKILFDYEIGQVKSVAY